eukprot:TRINITY_DN9390_c0_g5_i1.p2 TRINITY_DN9390_c0_g5~~TRINITY_DN9390_c0_g5_i1.p2  ORF type:complete len:192 (+),score=59.55 TRINITY_DN9390_c0_g5_i1:234-809(+)
MAEMQPLPTDNLWEEERAALRKVQGASAESRGACHRLEQAERIGRPERELERLQERRDDAEEALILAGAEHERLIKAMGKLRSRAPYRRRLLGYDARPVVARWAKSRSANGAHCLPPEKAVVDGGASRGKNLRIVGQCDKQAAAKLDLAAPPARPKWPSTWATPSELKAGPTLWWEPHVCGGRLLTRPPRR